MSTDLEAEVPVNKMNHTVIMGEEKSRIHFCHSPFAEEMFLGFKCPCFICQYKDTVIAGTASLHSTLTSVLEKEVLLAYEKAKVEHT